MVGALLPESREGLVVFATRAMVGMVAGALVATAAFVAPAFGKVEQPTNVRRVPSPSPARFTGSFTPSAADPRLAALLAKGGLDADGFRFTPVESSRDKRAVTVAVRARSSRTALASVDNVRAAPTQAPTVGIAPIAYNLGVSVGWKRFAVSGNVNRLDLGPQPGSRESADVAVTYRAGRASSRLAATTDRPLTGANRLVEDTPSYSVDMSSSYSLTRNLNVTAGVRYRSDRERIARLDDDRRDSQSVYLGTAFRF